eukprot:TRINITY_DN4867_c0_g1_i2.p1 TRINITY_DN4867_c0_g1~~TRINITY_DN4867_c0_g1_i2.p1  ORF type:complete len:382 (+),score=76.97 TRINITY_DN4867_c0_g1_i2:37-1146(+)
MALMEQAKAQAALDALALIEDDTALVTVIVEMLRHRPQVCPAVIAATCPELTYAPSKAITERRATGHMKTISPNGGYGFISCPELHAIFGCDIFAHMKQIGEIRPGTEVSFAVLLNKDNKPQAFDIEEISSWGGGGQPDMMMGFDGGMMGKGCMGKGGGGGGGYSGNGPSAVKTKICRDWQNGSCNRGSNCWFAHGEHEIGSAGGGCGGGPNKGGGKGGYGGGCGKGGWDGGADPMAAMQAMMPMMANMMGAGMGGCGGKGGAKGKGMGGGDGVDVDIGQFEGVLVKFNETKGMGFIQSQALSAQGYGDVFIHQKNLNGFQVGDEVTFNAYLHKGHSLQGKDLQGEPGNGRGAHLVGNMEPPSKMARRG